MPRGSEAWSESEVRNLRRAVRAVSDALEKQDRWRQIAALVGGGRSKRDCFDKYKLLKAARAEAKGSDDPREAKAAAPLHLLAEGHRPRAYAREPAPAEHRPRTVRTERAAAAAREPAPAPRQRGGHQRTEAEMVIEECDFDDDDNAGGAVDAWGAPPPRGRAEPRAEPRGSPDLGGRGMAKLGLDDGVDDDRGRGAKTARTPHPAPRPAEAKGGGGGGGGFSRRLAPRGPAPRGRSAPVSPADAAGLRELVLGDTKRQLPAAWKRQGFFFAEEPGLGYGLVQAGGGPCGVLAAVQAHLLRALLADHPGADADAKAPSSGGAWRCPPPRAVDAALVEALATIIWRCADGGRAKVCAPLDRPAVDRSATYAPDGVTERIRVFDAESREAVAALVGYHARDYGDPEGPGAILLLYSALLSRTVKGARSDMDEIAGERRFFVDRRGYASQEAVNLLLVGRATSNVFDGDRRLEDEVGNTEDVVTLRGIPSRGDVGFLTLHEAYGYYKVGDRLKDPRDPVWVVYSESHYSVLFAPPASKTASRAFDLYYWDGLANQDEVIRLSVDAAYYGDEERPPSIDDERALIPPLDLVVRSKWPDANVDWNATDPIL